MSAPSRVRSASARSVSTTQKEQLSSVNPTVLGDTIFPKPANKKISMDAFCTQDCEPIQNTVWKLTSTIKDISFYYTIKIISFLTKFLSERLLPIIQLKATYAIDEAKPLKPKSEALKFESEVLKSEEYISVDSSIINFLTYVFMESMKEKDKVFNTDYIEEQMRAALSNKNHRYYETFKIILDNKGASYKEEALINACKESFYNIITSSSTRTKSVSMVACAQLPNRETSQSTAIEMATIN